MSTAARITTNRPTTTQENFHIPRFALPSFIIRVPTGQGAGCGVMIFVFCPPLPAQRGHCLIEPSPRLLPEPRTRGTRPRWLLNQDFSLAAAAITGKASGAGGNGGAVAGGTLLRGILEVCFGRFHW